MIAAGGYGPDLIAATQRYVAALLAARTDAALAALALQAFIPDDFEAGTLHYFVPYEAVHRQNLAAGTMPATESAIRAD